MEFCEKSQEVLEKLWEAVREEGKPGLKLSELDLDDPKELSELVDSHMVYVSEDLVRLTPAGEKEAEGVIRRHRLAERLLNDVFATKAQFLEENACKFEHTLLYEGIESNICTLLGHPKVCPHGKPIPPGDCCLKKGTTEAGPIVSSLADLNPGQGGRIAYVASHRSEELQKLVSIGMIPGTPIKLIRRYPSYVFQVGNTQYAVDENVASEIYVRLESEHGLNLQEKPKGGMRWRWRWGQSRKFA